MKKLLHIATVLLIGIGAHAQEKKLIDVEEFEKEIAQENVIVVDVRKPDEYAEGYIKPAINIDWQNQDEFEAKASMLDKNKRVYLYCLAGVRSAKAAEWLRKNGFTNVISLRGGIDAWKKAGKALSVDIQYPPTPLKW